MGLTRVNYSGWAILVVYKLGILCAHPSPHVSLYLWFNHHLTWHDGTLAQNLLKALKILMTSPLPVSHVISCFRYRSRSKFEIFLSNLAEILHISQVWGAGFDFERKIRYKYDFSEKNAIFRKSENFGQALFNISIAMATPLVTVD